MRCKTYKTRLFVLLSIFGAFRAPCTNTFHFFWLGWVGTLSTFLCTFFRWHLPLRVCRMWRNHTAFPHSNWTGKLFIWGMKGLPLRHPGRLHEWFCQGILIQKWYHTVRNYFLVFLSSRWLGALKSEA